MPVRLLSSSILKWPDAEAVDSAVRRWAGNVGQECEDVQMIGYFGSYARGDWGVGSDLDVVVVVGSSKRSFERRGLSGTRPCFQYPWISWSTRSRSGSLSRDKGDSAAVC